MFFMQLLITLPKINYQYKFILVSFLLNFQLIWKQLLKNNYYIYKNLTLITYSKFPRLYINKIIYFGKFLYPFSISFGNHFVKFIFLIHCFLLKTFINTFLLCILGENMDKEYWRRIISTVILLILVILSFFLLKPILSSIIIGIILAFLFRPLYQKINKKINSKNLAATLVSIILVLLILIPLWFLTPIVINQSIQIFISSQNIDFVTPLKNFFPSIFSSEIFSNQIGLTIQEFVTKTTSSIMTGLADLVSNFPTLFLKTLVILFTFFFILRDNDKFIEYIQSVLPFSKDIEKRLFKSSRDITSSILYGQVIIGVLQGIFVGLGFFIFGVNNALFLTLAACLAGIFPIIGTTIIWVPVVIFLFVGGSPISALGIIFFGLISIFLENVVKPNFVSKRTNVHSSIILLGMVGGLFMFGFLGFILGPLILAYLLIILEIYRDKKAPNILIHSPKKHKYKKQNI